MANKFLKEVKVDSIATAPSFVNTPINTQEIIQATTGNKLNDIVLDTAISYSKKLDKMKASNEIAKSEIALNNAIKEYELSWQKRDKYSDENYNEYKTGLAKIYDEAKANFSNTQYTTEADVLEWENKINQSQANALYTQDGERANYDIKKTTDETLTNVSGLLGEYSATGDENLKLKALDMMNRLEDIGIPKGEIEQKKIKLLVKADSDKLEIDINKIINNPNLSLEDKKNQIKLMRDNLSSQDMFKLYTDESIKNKYLDKNSADTLMSYSKAIYQDKFLKAGGVLENMESSIRNEQYRIQIQLENEQKQKEESIAKEKQNVANYMRSGNDIKAVAILEGREIVGYDMIENVDLSQKYYGNTPKDILDKNEYIPTLSTYEINDMKNKARVDKENNIARYETSVALFENIASTSTRQERDNLKREYVVNGIMSQLEVDLLDNKVTPQNSTVDELINYSDLGARNSRLNKLGGFVGIGSGSATKEIREKLDKLGNDYYKKQQLSELIVGGMISGRFGITFDGTKGIDATSFRQAYNNNAEFKAFVDDSINILSQTSFTKYKKAEMKEINYNEIIDNKYGNKPIKTRRQSLEKGEEPYIEIYNEYDNF